MQVPCNLVSQCGRDGLAIKATGKFAKKQNLGISHGHVRKANLCKLLRPKDGRSQSLLLRVAADQEGR
ncbi:UNVERIFIED_CONTAM: hypothetical protein K2H54_031645 [Gekko kuhli]